MEFDKSKYDIAYMPDVSDDHIGLRGYEGLGIIINSLNDIYPKISDKMKKNIRADFNRLYERDPDWFYHKNADDYLADIEKEIQKSVEIYIDEAACNSDAVNEMNRLLPENSCINMSQNMNVEEFLSTYKFRDDISFSDKYNKYSDIPINKMKNYITSIHNIKKEVEDCNFSNLEKIIYVADLIRKRVYKDDEFDIGITRDVSRIIEDDYIVCEGYANLYQAICSDLGIECEKILWHHLESNNGHASNIVYINDDKYGIHNFYEIDLTAHSKKENNDDYLLDYDFIKPLAISDRLFKYNGYTGIEPKGLTLINRIEGRIERTKRMIELGAPDLIIGKDKEMIIDGIKEAYKNIGIPEDYFENKDLKSLIKEYKSRWKVYVPEEVLISAIYNVRRIEYIKDPETYKFDEETMMCILNKLNSFVPRRDETKLLYAIFGIGALDSIVEYNDYMKNIEYENTEDIINTDIGRVKVLSYMKKELQKKRNAS